MSLYLAVDADGARTECVIADDQRVLARVTDEGTQGAAGDRTRRLREVLGEVGEQAGVPLYLVTRACVGVRGLRSGEVRRAVESTLAEVLTAETVLVSEEEIALEAAFGQGPGVMVMTGAGSQVVARCGDGSRFTAGGWGPVLGDEGSFAWIGREGLRSGLRALDRGLPSSVMLKEMCGAWTVANAGALVERASREAQPAFGVLAEVVMRSAAAGDALARSVLERAGEELAAQVSTVLFRMRGASCAMSDGHRVAYTGGVLGRVPAVRNAMVVALAALHPQTVVDQRATEPIEGALARARREE